MTGSKDDSLVRKDSISSQWKSLECSSRRSVPEYICCTTMTIQAGWCYTDTWVSSYRGNCTNIFHSSLSGTSHCRSGQGCTSLPPCTPTSLSSLKGIETHEKSQLWRNVMFLVYPAKQLSTSVTVIVTVDTMLPVWMIEWPPTPYFGHLSSDYNEK